MLRTLLSRPPTASRASSLLGMSTRASSSSSSSAGPSIAPPGTFSPEKFPQQREAALKFAREGGWYEDCLVEAPVAWGEQDPNSHVNNAVYLRWLESGRLNTIRTLAKVLPEEQAKDLRGSGKGKGVILARLTYDYLRTTHHPDTILVLHRVSSVSPRKMILDHAIYSYDQACLVGKGEAVLVAFDYDNLKSTQWPDQVMKLVEDRGAKKAEAKAKL